MAISETDLQNLKESLEKEAGELEARLKEEKVEPEFGDDVDGFDEETDEASEYSNKLGLQQNIKKELENIEHALDKMSKGIYGKCENCGKEISLDVLKVDPESRLCRDCKLKK